MSTAKFGKLEQFEVDYSGAGAGLKSTRFGKRIGTKDVFAHTSSEENTLALDTLTHLPTGLRLASGGVQFVRSLVAELESMDIDWNNSDNDTLLRGMTEEQRKHIVAIREPPSPATGPPHKKIFFRGESWGLSWLLSKKEWEGVDVTEEEQVYVLRHVSGAVARIKKYSKVEHT
jgi:hypothetical protein